MKKYMTVLMTGLAALLATAALASDPEARDVLGENAFYNLDKDSNRTHPLILDGHFNTEVTAYLPDEPDGPAYEVALDYSFEVMFQGTMEGYRLVAVPEFYFTEEFLIELRENGTYVAPEFKMKHEGFADARTLDGNFYPHCDKILIYDIENNRRRDDEVIRLFATGLAKYHGLLPNWKGDVENLEVRALIYPGVPVLGAVKIDVAGDYSGMHIIAGGDYRAP